MKRCDSKTWRRIEHRCGYSSSSRRVARRLAQIAGNELSGAAGAAQRCFVLHVLESSFG
jgi:hypothetical protein